MQNSTSEISKVEGMLVKGFDKNGNETLNWERDFFKGNGAVLSTVEDLTKFLKAQFYTTNKELVLTRKETFNSDVNRSIGLGWHIKTNSYGKQFWHNGATGGYRSYMIVDVEKQKGVVILSNYAKTNTDKVGRRLMKTLY